MVELVLGANQMRTLEHTILVLDDDVADVNVDPVDDPSILGNRRQARATMTVRMPAHGIEISHGKEIKSETCFRFELRPSVTGHHIGAPPPGDGIDRPRAGACATL